MKKNEISSTKIKEISSVNTKVLTDEQLNDSHKMFIWSYFENKLNESKAYKEILNPKASQKTCKFSGKLLLFRISGTEYFKTVREHILRNCKIKAENLVDDLVKIKNLGMGYDYEEKMSKEDGSESTFLKHKKDLNASTKAIDLLLKLSDSYPSQKIDQNNTHEMTNSTGVLVINPVENSQTWESKYLDD